MCTNSVCCKHCNANLNLHCHMRVQAVPWNWPSTKNKQVISNFHLTRWNNSLLFNTLSFTVIVKKQICLLLSLICFLLVLYCFLHDLLSAFVYESRNISRRFIMLHIVLWHLLDAILSHKRLLAAEGQRWKLFVEYATKYPNKKHSIFYINILDREQSRTNKNSL